jgi:hypothetical protein
MKIIYIAGDGRSGSTLLDSVLNNAEDSLSIGEFSRFWTRYLEGKSYCGCDDNIRKCNLWSKIISEIYDKFEISLEETEEKIFQIRFFKNFSNIDKYIEKPSWKIFCDLIKYVYKRISEITNTTILIDSSKYPSWGYFLYKLNFAEFFFIHLERNLVDVANSWKKTKLLPEYNGKVYMPIKSNFTILKSWIKIKYLCHKISQVSDLKYVYIQYEDFCNDNSKYLNFFDEVFNLKISKTTLKFKFNHAIGGNPMRVQAEKLKIKKLKKDTSNLSYVEITIFETCNFIVKKYYD